MFWLCRGLLPLLERWPVSSCVQLFALAVISQPARVVGDLLKAEIAEKHARSITYQLTLAKLPLAKDVDDFAFAHTPRLSQRTKHLSQRGQRRSRLRARCPSRPLNLHR
jgi:hypothetical protein